MKTTKLILILFGIFFISLTSASTSLGTFKQNDCASIYQYCDDCTYVNLTQIQHPNGTIIIINKAMTKNDVDFNYSYCNTSDLGEYFYTVKGDKGGSVTTERLSFKITSTGKDFNDGQSMSSLGLLFGSLLISFLFLYIGFKFSTNPKLVPLSFFFVVLALILIIYALFLSWTIGSDILEHEAFSEPSEIIFSSFLWLIVGVAIISFIFMFFAFVKELSNTIKTKKFGEGFNPITNTYDY